MNSSLKNISTLLVVGILGLAGYFIFIQNSVPESSGQNEYITADMYTNAQLFIGYRSALETVAIDTSVFDNQLFKSYKNFTQPVNIQPVGRDNPFADTNDSINNR